MQLVTHWLSRTLNLLAAVLLPVATMHVGVCDCGGHGLLPGAAAVVGGSNATCGSQHGPCCHARQHGTRRNCCHAKQEPTSSCGCPCGAVCLCQHNKPPTQPATPATQVPSGKGSWSISGLVAGAPMQFAECAVASSAGEWPFSSTPATVNERLSLLCRFII